MPNYNGKTKLAFCGRLGNKWKDLADYFDVEISDRDRFEQSDEPREVWEWLERRTRLGELPEALRYIGREDLVVQVLEPPPLPFPLRCRNRLGPVRPIPACGISPNRKLQSSSVVARKFKNSWTG